MVFWSFFHIHPFPIFFKVQIFQSPGFSRSRVQGPGPGFRSSRKKQPFVIFLGKHLCWSLFLIKLQASSLKKFQYSQENPCIGVLFHWKETPTQVLFNKYGEIFKTSFFYQTPLFADSQHLLFLHDSPAIRSIILHFAPLRNEMIFCFFRRAL